MKIAFVVTRADDVGGAQVHVRDLAQALLRRGHDVAVLGGGSGCFSDELAARGVYFRSIRRLATPVSPVNDALALLELVRELRRLGPDIVSAHTAKAGLLGRAAAALLGLPAVFTPHGWSIGDRISPRMGKLFRRVETLASRWSSRIVNVCEFETELALKMRVAPRATLATVYNGIPDIAPGLLADASAQPPRIVMTARMAAPKEHWILLEALAGLKDLEWGLDFIGGGPLEAGLREQAARLGLGARVRFLGFCPDPAAQLCNAQIFVLASRSEAFPYSVLEAMRASLPVVATAVGGIPEAVADRRTGLLTPAGAVEPLRDALARLIQNPDLRRVYGAAGRRRYQELFSFQRMVAATMQIYEEACGRNEAAGAVDRAWPALPNQ